MAGPAQLPQQELGCARSWQVPKAVSPMCQVAAVSFGLADESGAAAAARPGSGCPVEQDSQHLLLVSGRWPWQ